VQWCQFLDHFGAALSKPLVRRLAAHLSRDLFDLAFPVVPSPVSDDVR
jgi:hypothetical protein